MEWNVCARRKAHWWWILGVGFHLAPVELLFLLSPSTGQELRLHVRLVRQSGLSEGCFGKGLHSTSFVARSKVLKASVAQSAPLPHLSSQPLSFFFFFLLLHIPSMLGHSLTPHCRVELLRVRKEVIKSQTWSLDKHAFGLPLLH